MMCKYAIILNAYVSSFFIIICSWSPQQRKTWSQNFVSIIILINDIPCVIGMTHEKRNIKNHDRSGFAGRSLVLKVNL